ncbi:MAG TPA: aminopeptidase [Nitrospiraceae bacterium]|nr:aminopeptidase [Nitrospiraceae bacterium]
MDIPAYLSEVVNVLAKDIGFRSFLDREKLDQTAQYIEDQLSSFGYEVSRQPFLFQGQTYVNLAAELKGTVAPEKILVVGAHYDTVRSTPGADDNGSGVAGLLALARLLAESPQEKTVRFVAFSLEEPPTYRTKNMGSYHYARSLKERNEQVEGMICLEMIGFFRDEEGSQMYPLPFFKLKFPGRGDYISLVGNLRSKKFTEKIASDFRKGTDLPFMTLNAPSLVVGIDFSDHWSFGKFGYPALMATDTAFYRNPHYHAHTDVPETLDYGRMTKVVQGLQRAIEAWGKT